MAEQRLEELTAANEEMIAILRKHGLFMGESNMNAVIFMGLP